MKYILYNPDSGRRICGDRDFDTKEEALHYGHRQDGALQDEEIPRLQGLRRKDPVGAKGRRIRSMTSEKKLKDLRDLKASGGGDQVETTCECRGCSNYRKGWHPLKKTKSACLRCGYLCTKGYGR